MSNTEQPETPGNMRHSDPSGFDQLFAFPVAQALETQQIVSRLTGTSIGMGDQIQRQHLALARAVSTVYLAVLQQSLSDLSGTRDGTVLAAREPGALPQPAPAPSGEQQLPQQPTDE